MADLTVTAADLEKIAEVLDAQEEALKAVPAMTEGMSLLRSHGVARYPGDRGFTNAFDARKAQHVVLQNAVAYLAKKVRDAKKAYAGTDQQAADNLDRQMLDR
jgi:uncharacterized protein YukE